MNIFGESLAGQDSEIVRSTFRLVVQRSTVLIAVICSLDAALFLYVGDPKWWVSTCVSLFCIPAYYCASVHRTFPVFLTGAIAVIIVVTYYCANTGLRYRHGINFHYKMMPIIPLLAVSGRLPMRSKWILIGLLTVFMVVLDYYVSHTPTSPLASPDIASLMRAINFSVPLLTIAALFVHYFLMVVQQQTQLQEHATTDPLTGLMNRRRLREVWALAEAEGRRGSFPLSIVLCDVDRFKAVNDLYGHEVGDEILRKLGEALRKEVRLTDSVCRWGGEEFLLLLPHADSVQALATSNRILQNIANTPLKIGSHTLSITITMGVATLKDNEKFEAAAHRADIALYAGKAAGRNRVIAAASKYPDTD